MSVFFETLHAVYALDLYFTFPLGVFCVVLAELRVPALIEYGKTLSKEQRSSNGKVVKFLHRIQVKRTWFIHFYVFSFILSGINSALELKYGMISAGLPSINNLYFVHSARRLAETYVQNSSSKSVSYMNVSHYLVGLWLYISFNYLQFHNKILPAMMSSAPLSKQHNNNSTSPVLVISFIILQYLQGIHHKHLRELKKYTIPYKYLFSKVYCAHYFIEVLIYLNLMMLDKFSVITVFPFLWTLINLSVSARSSQKWYINKFSVKNNRKKSIIPYIY